ncbi:MAG: hypothetical protein JNM98_18685 [Rhodocyclaceae bacterium]|nr:hypothetical protein [Rhodocyclaceae bacterium]
MKAYPYNQVELRATIEDAAKKNFGGDAKQMLEFMCHNTWSKALMDDGQSYLAFGPYWWAVKDIIERTIGSQWGETTAANPIMRKVFSIRSAEHADAMTLLLADEYRRTRLASYGVSPHHELDGEEDGDEYTLEDGDMIQFVFGS